MSAWVRYSRQRFVYTGRINDAKPVDRKEGEKESDVPPNPLLEKAIRAALEGRVPEVQTDLPMGCRIKRQ